MKVAILAGGKGTRLATETEVRPKPMVEIGGMPLLLHIMRHYSRAGFREFVVALGYKGEYIREYLEGFPAARGDLAPTAEDEVALCREEALGWTVDLVDTGVETLTAGRIRRLAPHLGNGTFMLTWGDGLSDVDLRDLLAFHESHGKLATVTAVRPPARYGKLTLQGDRVALFEEKAQMTEGWINGAFFVLEPGVMDFIDHDMQMWEHEPLERLARAGELMAYRHGGYWQCMDTLREKKILEDLWDSGSPPWKSWS